jgi:hypothetical protein
VTGFETRTPGSSAEAHGVGSGAQLGAAVTTPIPGRVTPVSRDFCLRMPAEPASLAIARLTAGGIAGAMSFSWDEIHDIRIALHELFSLLVAEPSAAGSVALSFSVNGSTLEIRGEARFDGPVAFPALDEMSTMILEAVVDEYEVGADSEGRPFFRLQKRPETAA